VAPSSTRMRCVIAALRACTRGLGVVTSLRPSMVVLPTSQFTFGLPGAQQRAPTHSELRRVWVLSHWVAYLTAGSVPHHDACETHPRLRTPASPSYRTSPSHQWTQPFYFVSFVSFVVKRFCRLQLQPALPPRLEAGDDDHAEDLTAALVHFFHRDA